MFEFSSVAGIAIIVVSLAYWWTTMKAKEIAFVAAKQYCRNEGLQLLDDGMAQKRFRLKRGVSGRLQLARHFTFEFTSTGDERYQGCVTVLGTTVTDIRLEAYRMNPTLH